ncbi:MAG: SsrA-binding protein SmpB [Wenzhouxiangellaceae bacterium]
MADKSGQSTIALNKRARHEYHLHERFEAGISLLGWEVKSLREGRIQFTESYVLLRNGEAFLIGTHISPLPSASTHVDTDPTRTRKLLLHARELSKLIGAVERKGFTLVPIAMYWKNGKVKVEIALATGKKQHDKRATDKNRDWQRQKQRILRNG